MSLIQKSWCERHKSHNNQRKMFFSPHAVCHYVFPGTPSPWRGRLAPACTRCLRTWWRSNLRWWWRCLPAWWRAAWRESKDHSNLKYWICKVSNRVQVKTVVTFESRDTGKCTLVKPLQSVTNIHSSYVYLRKLKALNSNRTSWSFTLQTFK